MRNKQQLEPRERIRKEQALVDDLLALCQILSTW